MSAPTGKPFVFSIRPQYVRKILDGSKVWEFRTRKPSLVDGDMILIYETAPRSMIVATAVVGRIMMGEKHWIWRTLQRKGVTLAEYNAYFDGHAHAVALHLSDVKPLVMPLPEGVRPPQSWGRWKGAWPLEGGS